MTQLHEDQIVSSSGGRKGFCANLPYIAEDVNNSDVTHLHHWNRMFKNGVLTREIPTPLTCELHYQATNTCMRYPEALPAEEYFMFHARRGKHGPTKNKNVISVSGTYSNANH